jgi:hypothetical protein
MHVHLAICPRCRPLFRSLRATKDALAALRDTEPPNASHSDK